MTERKVQKLKITILTVGKLKESYWKQAIAEYSKRLGLYTKLELVEVEDEKLWIRQAIFSVSKSKIKKEIVCLPAVRRMDM